MPDTSDNHGFDLNYALGDDWDYNQEFQTLEERVPVRDSDGNQTNYTPYSGAIFVARDTGAVYDGDGSAWNKATRELSDLTVDNAVSAGSLDATSATLSGDLSVSGVSASTVSTTSTISSGGTLDAPTVDTNELIGGVTGSTSLTDIAGNNLTIDSNGVLNAASGGIEGVEIRDSGTTVESTATILDFAADLDITGVNTDTVQIDVNSSDYAKPANAETITAGWTFSSTTTLNADLVMESGVHREIQNVNTIYAEAGRDLAVGLNDSLDTFTIDDFGTGTTLVSVAGGGDVSMPAGGLSVGGGNLDVTSGNVTVPSGTISQQGNGVLDTSDQDVVDSGTVQLSSGSAVIPTGLTSADLNISLDPSGGANSNASDVKVAARAFYDSAANEVKVEILEDGTSVGNPYVGYTVVQN